jgi:signal transduction histidine kinase
MAPDKDYRHRPAGRGTSKNGSIFPIDLGVTEIQVEGRRLFIGFIHDLSERRRFQAHLRDLHADRLDLMEHMTVRLANELKQPLAAITDYLNILRLPLIAPLPQRRRSRV